MPASSPIEMHDYPSSNSDSLSNELDDHTNDHPHDIALDDVGVPAAELARNLPELVEQLKQLRMEMEKCSKVYEAIGMNQTTLRNSGRVVPTEAQLMESYHASLRKSTLEDSHENMVISNTSNDDEDIHNGPAVLMNRPSSSINLRRSQKKHQQLMAQRSSTMNSRMSMRMSISHNPCDYTVMWVSGECGISLRNFSANKIGAQIAVLQQADGVTTGISHCRLGDQLLTVNDERVDELHFGDIVNMLKGTRRPITLGFRMTQNVQTSPTNGRGTATSIHSFRGSTKQYFPSDEDFRSSARSTDGEKSFATDMLLADRQTQSSDIRSSTSTAVSEDVELWCKEQEEMHSELLVLLTETVLRCEKLQQQNLDQLQNLMQLVPHVQSSSGDILTPLSTLSTTSTSSEAIAETLVT